MIKYPSVSLIISNLNGKDYLRDCLKSLTNLDYKGTYEIIVVDAGSTDGAPEMIEQEFLDVRLIRSKRIGIGEAINIGIRSCRGDIIGFDLNNDEVFSQNWLQNLVDTLLSSEKIGVVGGIRLLYGSDCVIDEAGAFLNYLGIQSSNIRLNLSDLETEPIETNYVGTIVFRRELINKIGFVDEGYYIYGEDADFCARVKSCGLKVLAVPTSISYHKRSETVGKVNPLAMYYNRRAKIRFILINFSFHRMFFALFWHLILLTVIEVLIFLPFLKRFFNSNTRLSFLVKGNSKENLRAVISAISWNISNFKETIKRRLYVKKMCHNYNQIDCLDKIF